MIRRNQGNDWLLISQLEHARIAAELAEAWNDAELIHFPHRAELLSAVRHHDDGWAVWESKPTINDDGEPREFTEMPMSVAMSIWIRSIDICANRSYGDAAYAAVLKEFREFLSDRGLRLTKEREAILGEVLQLSGETTLEPVVERLGSQGVSRSTVDETLQQLDEARIIETVEFGPSDVKLRASARTLTPSAYGALWVSRHFAHLAEGARESRRSAADIVSIDEFLFLQASLQKHWRQQIDAPVSDVSTAEESGFHWLQTFDRISLWLCCADRSERWDVALPSGNETAFVPQADEAIALGPFPFGEDVTMSVDGLRLPRQTFRDNEELRAAIREATPQKIEWRLVPGAK